MEPIHPQCITLFASAVTPPPPHTTHTQYITLFVSALPLGSAVTLPPTHTHTQYITLFSSAVTHPPPTHTPTHTVHNPVCLCPSPGLGCHPSLPVYRGSLGPLQTPLCISTTAPTEDTRYRGVV